MTELALALVDALDDEALDRLAERLAPRLAEHLAEQKGHAPWLDVEAAAAHLRCPKSRIYALVSTKRIPHHRDGSRLLFRQQELDDCVRAGGARRP